MENEPFLPYLWTSPGVKYGKYHILTHGVVVVVVVVVVGIGIVVGSIFEVGFVGDPRYRER